MAHYAYVNKGIVTSVIVGPDEGTEPEGITSWENYFSSKGKGQAIQTSYNTRGGIHYDPNTGEPSVDQSKAFRKNYAGSGYSYDETKDAFIPPKPFDSWILDEDSCLWEPPIEMPQDGSNYFWNEETKSWELDPEQ